MKRTKSGRIIVIAAILALGVAGSIYTGYWSKMGKYVTSIVSPASVEVPAWVKAAQGLQGVEADGSAAAGTTAAAAGTRIAAGAGAGAAGVAGAAYHGGGSAAVAGVASAGGAGGAGGATAASGQAVHGGPESAGFNAGLLPRIAGYATVLGLFAALVRLVELLRKRRAATRSMKARPAAVPAAAPAGVTGAVARETP